ncbi:MAG: YbjN domain-containing protein [Novosphingobium sp.]|nr:YbjN domain-containing protein [Novosphingobium sp.]
MVTRPHHGKRWLPDLAATAVFVLALVAHGPAEAAGACPAGTICAADPAGVAAAMQAEGYRARLGKAKDGDPMIESAAAGYDYTVQFYQCNDGRNCQSLQFLILFKDDGTNTPELANRWNKQKRFTQMAARDDGSLSLSYDVTTVGGLTRENFADVLDWWSVMLSQLPRFFSQEGAN